MAHLVTLGEHILNNQKNVGHSTGELSHLLSCIRLAAKVVNSEINKAGLVDEIMGQYGKTNIQGEAQQKNWMSMLTENSLMHSKHIAKSVVLLVKKKIPLLPLSQKSVCKANMCF